MTELSNNNKENIILVKKLAKEAYPKNKIMEDLTVCQAILESGLRGKAPSGLALKYNNLFGIKWPSLAKNIKFLKDRGARAVGLNTIEYTHTKIKAFFIWFKDLETCMEYRKFMMTWDLYKPVSESKTFKEACEKISINYATDPKYMNKLLKLKEELL